MEYGHFGCPECGSRDFYASRNYTEYGSCEVLCRYEAQRKSSAPATDDVEYLEHNGCDTDYGDYGEEMTCKGCQHTFTDPAWHEETDEESAIREQAEDAKRLAKEQTQELIRQREVAQAPYRAIIRQLGWNDGIDVEQHAHATLIVAKPSIRTVSDRSGEERFTVTECACCGAKSEHHMAHTLQAYFAAPHLPSGREKWLDQRGLPVLFRACLCKACRHINVISLPATAA